MVSSPNTVAHGECGIDEPLGGDPLRKRIRVLVVALSLSGGGAERVARTLLTRLDRDRFDPIACLHVHGGRELQVKPEINVAGILNERSGWHLPRAVYRLRQLIKQIRPDVVLSTIAHCNLVTGLAIRSVGVQPAWVARIGSILSSDGAKHRLLLPRLYPQASAIIANSEGLCREVESRGWECRVMRNPVDFDLLDTLSANESPQVIRQAPGTPLILAVGRLSPEKRYDVMLRAFALLRRKLPCRLLICGDGPHRAHVRRWIADLQLSNDVHLIGYTDDVPVLMRNANLFVMTSDHEGCPNALIEAQGLGLPAVATSCHHGPDEVVTDKVSGLLVSPGDANAVADAMFTVLSSPKLADSMSGSARLVRKTFAVNATIENWSDLLIRTAYRKGAQ